MLLYSAEGNNQFLDENSQQTAKVLFNLRFYAFFASGIVWWIRKLNNDSSLHLLSKLQGENEKTSEDSELYYDPDNLTQCRAFVDVKRKLRLVLSSVASLPGVSSVGSESALRRSKMRMRWWFKVLFDNLQCL